VPELFVHVLKQPKAFISNLRAMIEPWREEGGNSNTKALFKSRYAEHGLAKHSGQQTAHGFIAIYPQF
jgi:hypothetical protein